MPCISHSATYDTAVFSGTVTVCTNTPGSGTMKINISSGNSASRKPAQPRAISSSAALAITSAPTSSCTISSELPTTWLMNASASTALPLTNAGA